MLVGKTLRLRAFSQVSVAFMWVNRGYEALVKATFNSADFREYHSLY